MTKPIEIFSDLYGVRVVVDADITELPVWEFPKERFVEYGPEDESWCRCFGFGKEVRKPACYEINGTLYVHPQIYQKFQKLPVVNPPHSLLCWSL